MRSLVSGQFALMALACCLAQSVVAQNTAATSAEVEQHIQHVTSGLIGGVVIKGDENVTHTLADRMTELKVPGVSIAVIHQGKIEWARGFGVRSVGGPPVTADCRYHVSGRFHQQASRCHAIPLHMASGLAIIDAQVNNLPARLLLDTGASSLFLFARSTPGAVSDVRVSAVQQSSNTIGESERKQVKLHSLRLGTTEFAQEPAFLVPDGSHGGHPFDGLISPAGLGVKRVAIDLARGEVAFSR